jgi:predicted nucleic acid-binding protein
MIADTTFLIDGMRGDITTIENGEQLEGVGVKVNITSVSIFELYVRLNMSTKPFEEKSKIDKVLGNVIVNNLDFHSSCEAGEIFAEKKAQGTYDRSRVCNNSWNLYR